MRCDQKVAYRSPKIANLVLRKQWTYKDMTGAEPYLCPVCGMYHIGRISRGTVARNKELTEEYKGEME